MLAKYSGDKIIAAFKKTTGDEPVDELNADMSSSFGGIPRRNGGEDVIKQIGAWLPVVFWAFLIFHFSSGTVPKASAVFWQDFAVKKMAHFIFFGILALLVYRALRINKVKKENAAIYAVLSAFIYGASDEFHQKFTQGRESRIRDIFIDGVGAGIIVYIFYYFPPKLSKKMYTLIEKFDLV